MFYNNGYFIFQSKDVTSIGADKSEDDFIKMFQSLHVSAQNSASSIGSQSTAADSSMGSQSTVSGSMGSESTVAGSMGSQSTVAGSSSHTSSHQQNQLVSLSNILGVLKIIPKSSLY